VSAGAPRALEAKSCRRSDDSGLRRRAGVRQRAETRSVTSAGSARPPPSCRRPYTSAAMSEMSGGAVCPIMLRHKVRSEMNKTTPQPAMKAQP
jgi:hypothetical protein